MLNKNYPVDTQFFEETKGEGYVIDDVQKISLQDLEEPFKTYLYKDILSKYSHPEQLDIIVYKQWKNVRNSDIPLDDIHIQLRFPVLVLRKKTYYLVYEPILYHIKRDEGVIFEGGNFYYQPRTLMRFYNYYNEWLEQQKIS